jgi:hypothetical protein
MIKLMAESFMDNLQAICFIVLVSAFGVSESVAATYYLAPNGNDGSAGTNGSPWATFSKAMKVLKSGDMLLIKDGTYYQSLDVAVSGTQGSPITIKAEDDGQAIIDGQGARVPCRVYGSDTNRFHDINIEGIVCQNSSSEVFQVFWADRVNVRKVSAYNAEPTGNYQTFSTFHATYVLYEDCIAGGTARVMFNVYRSQYCTVRRCYGYQTEGQTGTPRSTAFGVQIYGSDNCVAENNVMKKNTAYSQVFSGIQVWANTGDTSANNNTVVGNVVIDSSALAYAADSAVYKIYGNTFDNNVSIASTGSRCFEAADGGTPHTVVNHLTCIGGANLTRGWNMKSFHEYYTKETGWINGATLKNSSFMGIGRDIGLYVQSSDPYQGTFTHTYNNFYGAGLLYSGTTAGIGEVNRNPSYDTAKYGKGAYLMVPPALQGRGEGGSDIGAEVLYQYQDGKLTNEPLWPWPTEDRIYRETGMSVTWERKGGLWKTLSGVYKQDYKIGVRRGVRPKVKP